MALTGLIRVADIARELGVSSVSVRSWLAKLDVPLVRAPTRGMPKSAPAGVTSEHSPVYCSIAGLDKLLRFLLPGLADRAERKARYLRLKRSAAIRAAASRNIVNEVVPVSGPSELNPG